MKLSGSVERNRTGDGLRVRELFAKQNLMAALAKKRRMAVSIYKSWVLVQEQCLVKVSD